MLPRHAKSPPPRAPKAGHEARLSWCGVGWTGRREARRQQRCTSARWLPKSGRGVRGKRRSRSLIASMPPNLPARAAQPCREETFSWCATSMPAGARAPSPPLPLLSSRAFLGLPSPSSPAPCVWHCAGSRTACSPTVKHDHQLSCTVTPFLTPSHHGPGWLVANGNNCLAACANARGCAMQGDDFGADREVLMKAKWGAPRARGGQGSGWQVAQESL